MFFAWECFWGLGDILCIRSMEKLCLVLESSIELFHKIKLVCLVGEEKVTIPFAKLEQTKLVNRPNTERENKIEL